MEYNQNNYPIEPIEDYFDILMINVFAGTSSQSNKGSNVTQDSKNKTKG